VGDLVIFIALVGLIGVAGVALGMLAARQLGAWDDRRAAAGDAAPAAPGSGSARDVDPVVDGGDPVD